MLNPSPRLDDRDAQAVLDEMLRYLPAYVPGWRPSPAGNSQALLQVLAPPAQSAR